MRERPPRAAFGWLFPVAGNENAHIVVKAPSDPSEGRVHAALDSWAYERGLELLGPLDEPRE